MTFSEEVAQFLWRCIDNVEYVLTILLLANIIIVPSVLSSAFAMPLEDEYVISRCILSTHIFLKKLSPYGAIFLIPSIVSIAVEANKSIK